MGGWGVLTYLAVGTTSGLVFLSIVADDVRRMRGAQDARRAALDRQDAQATRDQAAMDDREAAKKRRAAQHEALLGSPADNASDSEH